MSSLSHSRVLFASSLNFNRAMAGFRPLPETGDLLVPVEQAEAAPPEEGVRRLSTLSWDEAVAWHDSFCWQAERSALRVERGSGWVLGRDDQPPSVGRELGLKKCSLLDGMAAFPTPLWRSRYLPNRSLRTYFRRDGVGIETLHTPRGFRTERIDVTVTEAALVGYVGADSLWPKSLRLEFYAIFPERLMRAAARSIAMEIFEGAYPWVADSRLQSFWVRGAQTLTGVALTIPDTEEFVSGDELGLEQSGVSSGAVTVVRSSGQRGGPMYRVAIANASLDAVKMGADGARALLYATETRARASELGLAAEQEGILPARLI